LFSCFFSAAFFSNAALAAAKFAGGMKAGMPGGLLPTAGTIGTAVVELLLLAGAMPAATEPFGAATFGASGTALELLELLLLLLAEAMGAVGGHNFLACSCIKMFFVQ